MCASQARSTSNLVRNDAAASGTPTAADAVRDDDRRHAVSTEEQDDETSRRPILVPKADRRRQTRS